LSLPAIIFWSLFTLTGLLFFALQRAVRLSRKEELDRLIAQSTQLEETIRTQPPAHFLATFADLYAQADRAASAIFALSGTVQRDQVEAAARHVLRIIAVLAQKFDDPSDGGLGEHEIVYAANVMIYKPTPSIPPVDIPAIDERMLFRGDGVTVSKLKGVLDLVPTLSTTAADPKATPDPSLRPFALGIPNRAKAERLRPGECELRYRVLPGAPRAFCDREADIYENTNRIREWCERYGDFTDDVKDAVETYFETGPGANIGSFVSIPLFHPEDLKHEADPVGVLNIHSNAFNLLKGRSKAFRNFVAIAQPLQILLSKLLLQLPEIGDLAVEVKKLALAGPVDLET